MLYNFIDITKPLEFNSIGKCKNASENYVHRKSQLSSFELIIVTEGTLYLKVGFERHSVQSGQYLLLQPDEANPKAPINHLQGYQPSLCSFYWMHFSSHNHTFIENPSPNDMVPTNHGIFLPILAEIPSPEKVLVLMRTLQDHRRSEYIGSLDYGNYLATLILLELYQQFSDNLRRPKKKRPVPPALGISAETDPSALLYHDLTDYIYLNLNQNLKIQDLAEHFGYTPKHLSLVSKRNSGLSLKQYIQKLKMERAQFLLLDTNSTIQEIAANLGFPDSHNFSRNFKACTGMTPSEYRHLYRYRINNQ